MARTKNSTFQGASAFNVDVDALTRKIWAKNVAGDLALVIDKITGQNGETSTCNHGGGAGRGALLGVPIINQFIGRSLTWDDNAGTVTKTSKDGGVGPTWIFAAPCFVSPGETELVVNITHDGIPAALKPVCYLRETTAFAAVGDDRVVLDQVSGGSGPGLLVARIRNITSGAHLFFVEVDTTPLAAQPFYFGSITVTPNRERRAGAPRQLRRLSTSPFGVTAPGATQGFVPVDYDDAAFADGTAINGHFVFRHNRLINALWEYITGATAGGNASRTLVDHDGAGAPAATNPARSRALAHTRSLYAAEPEIAWPLLSMGFGAFRPDGGFVVNAVSPPTAGFLEWFAPWRIAASTAITTQQIMRRLRIPVPDFQTSSSRLKWRILVGTDSGTVTSWVGGMSCGGATATANFVVVPGTNNKLAIASGSALAFSADTEVDVTIGLSRALPLGAVDECVLLGADLYFEP